ncbi:MAG: hypothetical protein WDN31_15240 [Hyphomicrobium sp.]
MASKKPAKPTPTRAAAVSAGGGHEARAKRKLLAFDPETLQALHLLGRDSMKDLQELADEAFRDLLKKHGRPSSLKEALRQSTRQMPANDRTAKVRTKAR